MSSVGFENDGKVEKKCTLGHGVVENSNQLVVTRMLDVVIEAKSRVVDVSLDNLAIESGSR